MRRVKSSWRVIDAVLKEQIPAAYRTFCPPASAAAIAKLEHTLGVKLPACVVSSYLVHDGMRDTPETLNNFHRLLTLPEIASYRRLCLQYPWDESVRMPKYGHAGRIKTDLRWRPKWVPLMVSAGGDLVCLDLDPGPAGTRGQVFRWYNYGSTHMRVMAGSFREWLDRLATEYEAGRFSYTDEDGVTLDLKLG
jgi:cell wall assembly regulator SMI1